MTKSYILPLANLHATLETVGGKGASLARLSIAGLPVPNGFHVTTAAYKQFVEANQLQERILAALSTVEPSLVDTLETASRAITTLFLEARIPVEIGRAIESAYDQLLCSDAVVAVRSSATAEDLPGLSFAGQQETYLNIRGLPAVLEAVRRCWASLWTARAIGYRAQHDIPSDTISLAVVVQELVMAEASGVMFTANPANGRRDQTMITAAWGLGEAIVGGLVTPDTLVIDKASGQVASREIADKAVMTVRMESGTEEQPVPERMRKSAILNDTQAAELTQIGGQIETCTVSRWTSSGRWLAARCLSSRLGPSPLCLSRNWSHPSCGLSPTRRANMGAAASSIYCPIHSRLYSVPWVEKSSNIRASSCMSGQRGSNTGLVRSTSSSTTTPI